MGTPNYDFPLIDPTARFDGANDINKLADAIDSKMKQVEVLGRDAQFTLEPATATRLGGVRIGANVNVSADGTISTDTDPYVLPPASNTTLGGVIVPSDSGINLTPEGQISIDDDSVKLPAGSVGTAQLQNNAVSNLKIANEAVTYEKLSASLKGIFDDAEKMATGTATEIELIYKIGSHDSLVAKVWGPLLCLFFTNFQFALDSQASSLAIATVSPDALPAGTGVNANSMLPLKTLGGVDSGNCVGKISEFIGTTTLQLSFNGDLAADTYVANGQLTLVFA